MIMFQFKLREGISILKILFDVSFFGTDMLNS